MFKLMIFFLKLLLNINTIQLYKAFIKILLKLRFIEEKRIVMNCGILKFMRLLLFICYKAINIMHKNSSNNWLILYFFFL
jgi:hypothetical protein